MNKTKIIIFCAVILGIAAQMNINTAGGKPQRKYYAGNKAVEQRIQMINQAAEQGESIEGGGLCSGGICTLRSKKDISPTEAALLAQNQELEARQRKLEIELKRLQEKADAQEALQAQEEEEIEDVE